MEEFCSKFTDVFQHVVTENTKYRNIENWSSLGAVLVCAMIEENYGKIITDDDIKNNETVGDLYKLCF